VTAADGPPFGDDLLAVATRLVEPYMGPGEMPAFLAGAQYLAEKRARMLNRRPRSMDLLHILFLFLSCPWARSYSPQYMERMSRIREYIFAGADAGNFQRLDDAVLNAGLLFMTERLYELHDQEEIEGFLRIPPDLGPGYEQG
jgi:hypothetical protein